MVPNVFAEVQGKRILDWTVEALKTGGIGEICFIGGYLIDDVRSLADLPEMPRLMLELAESRDLLPSAQWLNEVGLAC